jgi:hypothetical protein
VWGLARINMWHRSWNCLWIRLVVRYVESTASEQMTHATIYHQPGHECEPSTKFSMQVSTSRPFASAIYFTRSWRIRERRLRSRSVQQRQDDMRRSVGSGERIRHCKRTEKNCTGDLCWWEPAVHIYHYKQRLQSSNIRTFPVCLERGSLSPLIYFIAMLC